jgi:syntaxin-binding protein 1
LAAETLRVRSSSDKLRIIALYIVHRDGVPEEDRKRLYQHARLLLHEMDAVNNLALLGQSVTKASSSLFLGLTSFFWCIDKGESKQGSGRKRNVLFKQRAPDDAYDISRYQPALKLMVEEHLAGRLDRNNFPYVGQAPRPPPSSRLGTSSSPAPSATTSLRSARPRWQSGVRNRASAEPRQRVIVFGLGGITYSEIRSAYQISLAGPRDVYIGTSS